MTQLSKGKLSEARRRRLEKEVEKRKKEVVSQIISLNLNQDKIKRLTNKIKSLAAKIQGYVSELESYKKKFGDLTELSKMHGKFKRGKITKSAFKQKTKFNPTAIEAALVNVKAIKNGISG